MLAVSLFIASPAAADVCTTLRPGWNGTTATQWSEAIGLLTSPAGLFLSAALAMAVLFRHQMGTALVALLWALFIMSLIAPAASNTRDLAILEGCAAPPTLFIGLSAAICALAVMYTFRRDARP